MQLQEFVEALCNQPAPEGTKHRLAKPITEEKLAEWEEENPEFRLPESYKALLRQANGIKLCASADSPNGLLTILPLGKTKPLAEQVMEMCGLEEEDLTDPPTCLMIGEDQDSAWCLGLDTANGHYLEVAYTGETTDLGELPEFLDWVNEKLLQNP